MPNSYSRTSKTSKPRSRKRLILSAAGVIGVLAVVIVVLELTDTTHIFHARKAVSSTITGPTKQAVRSSAKAQAQSNGSTDSSPATSSDTSNTKDSSPSSPTAELTAPYGSFVSNHHPGANGSPSSETSVCTTTPGAKCYIRFISQDNPSVVKTLATGTADSTGAVYWNNWDVKDAGFTNGTWNIQAIATLGTQTKTTNDSAALEVSL